MVHLLPTRYRHRENRPVTYLASRILSWFILFIKGDLLKGKKKSTIGIDRKFEWKGREIEGIETRSMGQGFGRKEDSYPWVRLISPANLGSEKNVSDR